MLEYPYPDPPLAGERRQVAPGVCWLRMPLPFALDHINLWLIEDGEGWTVVDTGIAIEPVRAAWENILAELGERPVKRIVVTHFHPDHLGLADWLAGKTGAGIWMTAGEFLTAQLVWHQLSGHGVADMLEFFRSHGLDEARLTALGERGNAYRKGVPQLPRTYQRIYHGDTLTIGAHRWHIEVGHGHAPEHAALFCPELEVLISGDMLLPRITSNISTFAVTPDIDNLARYLASLAEWRALPNDTLVLPSHGLPFRGVHERLDALDAHHAERLARVEHACEVPMTAAQLMPVLFERELDAHQTLFAMGESIAHLNHLRETGRLARICGTDGTIRFQRINPHR